MTIIKALNPAHQSQVNRAVKSLIKYNALNNLRDEIDYYSDEKLYAKIERKCQNAFDAYLDFIGGLPKREINNIEKSELY